MVRETILTRYAAGERSFPQINLQEAELTESQKNSPSVWHGEDKAYKPLGIPQATSPHEPYDILQKNNNLKF